MDESERRARGRERAEVVAAVCYRQRGEAIQFLLVMTRDGDRWTFPKGHVEEGETPRDAVMREAREEAGVGGAVEDHPFTHYAYPAWPPGREILIAAYLLSVESQTLPAVRERRREPTWFDPAVARTKLAEGRREPRHAAEHGRVLDAALARLRVATPSTD
jgi:8-oxo-dGTP pyrophosphatase MutT (NUDIX family)